MKQSTLKKSLLKNNWIRFIVSAILFVTLVLLILPIAGKFYFTNWLLDNGADTAVIKKIRINPFIGKASLDGVHVIKDGATVPSNTEILVDIGLMSLLKKQVHIEEKNLNDVTLDIELYEDGRMRFASYTTTPPTAETVTEPEPEDTSTSWVILARQVTMSNCRIRFKMPDLAITLQVDDASLANFSTEAGNTSGTFSPNGSVNGTPITLDLHTLGIVPDFIARGAVKVEGFELDNLADFLKPYLKPFTGRASVEGSAMFKLTEAGALFVDYDGMISLEKGHIAGDSFSVQGAPVRWGKGTVHFELTKKKGIIIDVDGSLTGKEIAVDIPDPIIQIKEPDVAINGKVLVTIDDEIRVDTCAGFTLKHTTFTMPPLQAEAANTRWQGKKRCVQFNSGTADKELSVQVQGELLVDTPSFAHQDKKVPLAVNGASLAWNGEVSYLLGLKAKDPSIVQTNGKLTGNKLALTLADFLTYKQGTLTTDGKSTVSLADDNSMKVVLDGDFKTKKIEAKFVNSGLLITQQSLETTTKGTIDIGQDIALEGKSSLNLNGFTITKENAASPLVSLKAFTINSIEAPGGKEVSIKQAGAKGLNVNIEGNMPLKALIPTIALSDIYSEDLATFSTTMVSVLSPVVVATKNNKKLAGLGTLEIRDIMVGLDQQVTVDRANFDDLFFLGESAKDDDNICQIDGASLSEIGWSPEKGLYGESLSFAGLFCTLIREKDGLLTVNKELAAMSNPSPIKKKTSQETEKKEPRAKINLEQITLRGDSGIHIEDHTLEVPYTGDLDITTLQIRGLNSGKPAEPAKVKMIGTLAEKRAPLKIDGSIAPFGEVLAMDMTIEVKNFPLPRLSPYTVQAVGVALASGELQLKSDILISENELDMDNEVLLKKLETSTISKELADKLDNQLPIPLESALSLLRDKDDDISLDIPLSGPLDELKLGISDILITALGKAIVPAASSYLMSTLGPYGAITYVGMKIGQKMLEVKLPPVEFTPGRNELPKGIEDYLSRLAQILQDQPEADLQLYPQSSAWEFTSESKKKTLVEEELELTDRDKEKLMQLGQERAQNIKDYLIRKFMIDKDRLLISITDIDTEKSATPRVEIQM